MRYPFIVVGNGNDIAFIKRIFYIDIFKCTLQHFVGDFARLLYGAVHNLFSVTSRIHRCPQNRMSDGRPQHQELHVLVGVGCVFFSMPLSHSQTENMTAYQKIQHLSLFDCLDGCPFLHLVDAIPQNIVAHCFWFRHSNI